MPNWTQNRITFKGNPERILELKQHILIVDEDEDSGYSFDFNRVIPMPEVIKNTIADNHSDSLMKWFTDNIEKEDFICYETYCMWFNEQEHKHTEILTQERFDTLGLCFVKYGSIDWYQWSVKNWGCKWNSSETRILTDEPNELSIGFQTPWNEPTGVLSKLNELYGDLHFESCHEHEGGYGGQKIVWDPNLKTFTVQRLEEYTVYDDDNDVTQICSYDEENDEFLDINGNPIEDYYSTFLPVGESWTAPQESCQW